jgi:hypothetical protein
MQSNRNQRLMPPAITGRSQAGGRIIAGVNNPEIELLRVAYAAFNARDIDAALATMAPDVSWPKAFKGGFAHGHEAVRAYWTQQWSEIDPRVEPLAFHREPDGRILVDVHQVVRDLAGKTLADLHVGHRFTLANGVIQTMEVCPPPAAPAREI